MCISNLTAWICFSRQGSGHFFFFFSVKGQAVKISGYKGLIVSAELLIPAGVVWKQPQEMCTHVHMAGFPYNLDVACGL